MLKAKSRLVRSTRDRQRQTARVRPPENLKGAAKLFIDKKSNELIVADGYGNHRVIVFDAETGKYKRHWGAYGKKPDDTPLSPKYSTAEIFYQERKITP